MDGIEKNLIEVRQRIAEAAARSGRKPEDVTLVGVTKTVSPDRMLRLISLGVRDIGENKAQEMLSKYDEVNAALPVWHFIGTLQKNKVRQIIGKVAMIHSLDSFSLAEEIDTRAGQACARADVLIEVNIADELSKSGIKPEETRDFAEKVLNLGNVNLRGLMCIAPFVEKPDANRKYFAKMYELFVDIKERYAHNSFNIDCLSAGMTIDFETAVEEGANIVRIGTGIFGER